MEQQIFDRKSERAVASPSVGPDTNRAATQPTAARGNHIRGEMAQQGLIPYSLSLFRFINQERQRSSEESSDFGLDNGVHLTARGRSARLGS
jgi:hypothetical protein